IAAAYSSADSALTSLTTSFCIDILGFEKKELTEKRKTTTRQKVHVGFSLLLFLTIQVFWWINNDAVISSLFKVAGYTYGPLLGLYTVGFCTASEVRARVVALVCILPRILRYILNANSEHWMNGHQFGFEILLVNALLTVPALSIISKP